jgi:nucleoside-diphosphate-sugar epimerase
VNSSSPASRPVGRTLLVGYGKLGSRLADRLLADGEKVFALRRSESDLPDGVRGFTADVSTPLAVELPVVDSMLVTLPPGPRIDSYRVALGHLAVALPQLPERTLFVSSTGVFEGAAPDPPLTEQDEPPLSTDRARGLRDGERAAQELFSAVVVRPAGIYGQGRDFLLRRVREQVPVDHQRWTNRIHETDLVRTLETLLRMPTPPLLVHAVDGTPAPLGDVVSSIGRMLSLPAPPALPSDGPTGHVLDGALLRSILPRLENPSYVEGYAEMIGIPPAQA